MKIKCPICHKIYDTEEANHYAKMHNDLEIGQCLTDLVFKIHEKIEFWQDNKDHYIIGTWYIDSLKSLLESETEK